MPMIRIDALTASAFAPFGDVLEAAGGPDRIINRGFCGRWHDRAKLDFGPDGRAGISIFRAEPRALPYTLDLVDRHPDGSQAFLPMHEQDWLVIVAEAGGTCTTTGGAPLRFNNADPRVDGIVAGGTAVQAALIEALA